MTEQTRLQRLKLTLSLKYFGLMNLLHRPLVRRAEDDPYHRVFAHFREIGDAVASPAVLEIGSRNVSGITRPDIFPHQSKYVGFDMHPGEGVTVVGDCHRLSSYLPPDEFHLVYTVSVFEHLMFPWKAVLEINRVMKTGGHLFVSTHPAWPAHELPWDFWRFMRAGFHALFNEPTGFELVAVSEGLPCKGYALVEDRPASSVCFHEMNMGVAAIARKTGAYRDDLLKWDVDTADVMDSVYPGGLGPKPQAP